MTHTLLIRLIGPMQAWGTKSRFGSRDTESAPTKSGVVGLLAAAKGMPRDADVTQLAALRMGVRADRPGIRMRDFHTALDVVQPNGRVSQNAVIGHREYLADAAFLIGLESHDLSLLDELQASILDPHWPLALGRRAFAPSVPIAFSSDEDPQPIVPLPLERALVGCEAVVKVEGHDQVRYYVEDRRGDQEWFDQPLDNFKKRTFRARSVLVREAGWGEPWS